MKALCVAVLLCGSLLAAVSCLDGNGHPDLAERPTCGAQSGPHPKTRVITTERLAGLRSLLADPLGNAYQPLDAYIVPMDDEHQTEYIAPQDRFIKFISGFSGSAALVAVTAVRAALWTDGRYFLQAEDQLDCNWYLMKEDTGAPELAEWLTGQLKPGARVGSDPKRMAALRWIKLSEKLKAESIDLVSVEINLIEHLWTEGRPVARDEPITVYPLEFAGRRWQDKVADVRAAMKAASSTNQQVTSLLVTQLDEVAWLFNLRGDDLPNVPEFKSYAVVEMDAVHLFVDSGKLTPAVRAHLAVEGCQRGADCVMPRRYEEMTSFVAELSRRPGMVWIPSSWSYAGGASYALYEQVDPPKRLFQPSPIIRLKGMKNSVEIASMKQAHLRDSTALCSFLAMLEKSVEAGEPWTELSVEKRLDEYRGRQDKYRGRSFNPIVGFGPNGAVIHYKASEATSARINTSSLLLIDSGGQYLDGSTDVTRTMHYGEPTDFMRETYTRVLMGVIDLGKVVFKKGATDSRLDILARRHLYEVGLDYLHGTGHGIGVFLQIHEAPTQLRIYQKEEHLMEEGMFFSNEPGYYESGQFGIRLETIMFAKPASDLPYNFSGPYLTFEPVTLVPFEPKLIKTELLTHDQLAWLNAYHARVRRDVGAMVTSQGGPEAQQTLQWLEQKTQPIVNAMTKDCPAPGAAGSPLQGAVVVTPAVLALLTAVTAAAAWRLA
ncbi:probable Xaa-Pro aminopeptidase P [Amphibalanus amphitrite]|uniref:probable Xaa-Pro aminopeptidase P n=1 Tax=Amphibalanus amphitrite TaxID=1232801 RepID=UPI001C918432|nr:probable Xaa-Pro aminopeptidase P [Amphibalanus amphitrite]XP_043232381.1 probable Xaa-Pro aminopeptidase P [Amphibalanus amphitrite]